MYIVAIIPARGGSKGIPRKNVINYCGKPLIAHSIDIAKQSKFINEIIVSTDDDEIADIAKEYGAIVPFKRPAEYARDESTDTQVMFHYLGWLQKNNKNIPDLIVQLRPTYPNRNIKIVDQAIDTFLHAPEYDSLRSVIPATHSPFKTYWLRSGDLIPLFTETIQGEKEPFNMGRQYLEQAYLHNGYIDIIRMRCMLEKGSITGDKIYPFVMENHENTDIDEPQDLQRASACTHALPNQN